MEHQQLTTTSSPSDAMPSAPVAVPDSSKSATCTPPAKRRYASVKKIVLKPHKSKNKLQRGDRARTRSAAVRPHRFKPGTVAKRDVTRYQKTTHYLIQRAPFRRIVKGVFDDLGLDQRITSEALRAIQSASEDFIIDGFRCAKLCAEHVDRTTVRSEDIALAVAISSGPSLRAVGAHLRRSQQKWSDAVNGNRSSTITPTPIPVQIPSDGKGGGIVCNANSVNASSVPEPEPSIPVPVQEGFGCAAIEDAPMQVLHGETDIVNVM